MTRKAFVDREVCIGCNVCAIECAVVFTVKEDPEHDNSFKSFPDASVDQEPIADKVDKAINMCPVSCISWKEKSQEVAAEQK